MDLRAQRERDVAELNRRMAEADTPEERQKIIAEYDRTHPAPETIAADPTVQRVTWAEAREWWPYPTLLRLGAGLKPGYVEDTVVSSESGGLRGDPHSEYAYVVGYYQYNGKTIENSRALQIDAAGGIILQNFVWPKGTTPAPLGSASKNIKAIQVRGHAAVMQTRTPEDSNVYLRTIRWQEPAGDGGTLEWRLECDPRKWSESELIDVLNQAQVI